MNLRTGVCLILLLVSAHRLAAPISEVQEPVETAPPKPKPAREKVAAEKAASPQSHSNSLQKFDGTWSGSASNSSAHHSQVNQSVVIIKSDAKTASATSTLTQTLVAGQIWSNLSEDYNSVSPIVYKFKYTSTDLSVDGSNLRVRWSASQLVDWSPKTIPYTVIQPIAVVPARMSVYTLRGDQLTREFDSNGGVTYKRVK